MNHPDTDPFVGEIFSKCYLDSYVRHDTEYIAQSILQSKVLVQKVGGGVQDFFTDILYGQLFRRELLPSIESYKMCILHNFLPFECIVYTLSNGQLFKSK